MPDPPLPRFCELPDELSDPATAAAAILPVPYDRTSTWKRGADQGPRAILEASHHIEWYDLATGEETCRRSIATLEPVLCNDQPEVLADQLDPKVGTLIERGTIPVVLGGDHSVAIGAIRGAARVVPGLSVLQIDAHADTRDSYHGSRYNHACVMARAREWCEIVQVGVRAVDAAEMPLLDPRRVVFAHQICGAAPETGWMDRALAGLGDDVYVTIDLDGFDPAVVPATGTPEPGGLDWYQVTGLLERVAAHRRVVGFDVVELLPTPGQWASEFLAAKLVYRFLSDILKTTP
ncbi:MAG: agmatinase [Thermoanaerobaculales bacterium]|jgi:agmatinase|nr:agmatinase [Thermoanaerobaculales bacterium]